jgi:hypothetical protein
VWKARALSSWLPIIDRAAPESIIGWTISNVSRILGPRSMKPPRKMA